MNEEMFENTIRKNDEHWLDNCIGLTLNKRIEQAIHKRARQETIDYLVDRYNRGKINAVRMHETVAQFCSKNGKILDLAINKPNDLILDNFGIMLAGLIKTPVAALTAITMKDDANANMSTYIYGTTAGSYYYPNDSTIATGTLHKIGSGSTAAQRSNYAIQTAFATSPESGYFGTGNGSYAVGYISFASAITAGGSGTVNETGFFVQWGNTSHALKVVMFFHDILGAGVAFTPGKTLTTSYSIAL